MFSDIPKSALAVPLPIERVPLTSPFTSLITFNIPSELILNDNVDGGVCS